MKDRNPEAKLIIATRWAPVSDFYKYVQDPKQDIITLQPLNEERRAVLGTGGNFFFREIELFLYFTRFFLSPLLIYTREKNL